MNIIINSAIKERYGATPTEWEKLRKLFGDCLMPSICDPNVKAAPNRPTASFLKTPSAISSSGFGYRIKGWNTHRATEAQIDSWSQDDRLGICASTREITAIDIDLSSEEHASLVESMFKNELCPLPLRTGRGARRTLFVRIEGGEKLRRHRLTIKDCQGEQIELLASGQQSMLAGAHKSGTCRYSWPHGIPETVPTVTLAQFTRAWELIARRLSTTPDATFDASPVADRRKGSTLVTQDKFVDFLEELQIITSVDGDKVHLLCPWSENHSTSPTEYDTSSTYMPRGTNGYSIGNYRCMHAHCETRTVADLWAKLQYEEDISDEFDIPTPSSTPDVPPPNWVRTKKSTIDISHPHNHKLASSLPQCCGMSIRTDTFGQVCHVTEDGKAEAPYNDDTHPIEFRAGLALRMSMKVSLTEARAAIRHTASANSYDSMLERLAELPEWDGVARVKHFARDILKCKDSAYATAVSLYMWTALAGRASTPTGLQADMVPVLGHVQGIGKSTVLRALALRPSDYNTANLDNVGKDDIFRAMQGKTVIELPELSKISTKSEDKIKEFITMGTDSWTPKYSNQPVTVVRRSIMFATTNKRRYLTDVTGNRRWLPLTCCAEGGMIDRDTLIRERDQYWAEALTLFKETGIQWREAEALAKPYIDAATVINPWHNLVARYLADGRTATDGVSIYLEALGGDRRSFDDRTQRKIARCLTMLGWDSPNADDNWVMSDLD